MSQAREALFRTASQASEPEVDKLPRRTMIREIAGTAVGLLGIFVLVSLLIAGNHESLVGPVGAILAEYANLILGRFVAFLIPVAIIFLGVQLFRARPIRWSPVPGIGLVILIMSITGLIALPYADDLERKSEAIVNAGALGTFMVNWEGLRLVGAFGSVGAAMILIGLAIVAVGLITNLRLSELVTAGIRRLPRREEKSPRIVEALPRAAEPPGRTAAIVERDTPLVDVEEDELAAEIEAEKPTPRRSGLFGALFGGREKEPLLSDPDPEESQEFEVGDEFMEATQYDEDALAAVRALDEARIDEEYERLLREEEERGNSSDENPEIIYSDSTQPYDTIVGNPANDEDPDQVGEGLAKLFPSKWSRDGETVVRKSAGKDADESVIRDKAEARALRRAAEAGIDIDDELEIDGGNDGEDDPLFDNELDTRPAGPIAAQQAASESALAKDDALAHRNRMLAQYRLPDVQLLEDPPRVDNRLTREEVLEISQTLERTFNDFNISLKVVEVKQGPVVTRFELKPAPGVKVSRIVSLEHDITLAMRAQSVRIVAPIPGKAAVGIEIPNKKRAGVYLKELVSCPDFWDHPSPLGFALGKTIEGAPYFADLKKMPHLLIAGATGAGKSVCLNTIICSFLYRMRPDRLRMLMIDPKRVELSIYQNVPHLISPVVCDAKRAAAALHWAVEQMEERYKKLVAFNVRNIDGYNEIALNPEKQARHRGKNMDIMPHMVVVVDEFADLMVVAKAEVEESIQRLAQMARAVGIHLILATQRPSVNVITGIIKANFPTRIAFQVSQKVDSRTILDGNGAEALLGRGDMLFAPAGAQKPIRLQGCFLSDEEVERIADHCRTEAEPMYEVEEFEPLLSEKEQRELARMMGTSIDSMDDLDEQDRIVRGTNKVMGRINAGMFVPHDGGSAQAGDDEIDEALVRAAARVIFEGRKGSTSLIQRRLKVGFARAGRLMDMLEDMGLVGPYKGSKPRDLLVDPDAALDQLDALETQMQKTGDSRRAAAELDGGEDQD